MRRITQAMFCAALVFGIVSCRASFQDIQKSNLVSSGDDLSAKDDKSSNATPNYPTLENTKELPPEDSESYGCDGTVLIHEKGKDKNLDNILQPTEVTDISTECKMKDKNPPGGKDPGQNPPPPPKCPNQSKDPKDKCDCPNQSKDGKGTCDDDPHQSGKK